jgi:hypothetical protein
LNTDNTGATAGFLTLSMNFIYTPVGSLQTKLGIKNSSGSTKDILQLYWHMLEL